MARSLVEIQAREAAQASARDNWKRPADFVGASPVLHSFVRSMIDEDPTAGKDYAILSYGQVKRNNTIKVAIVSFRAVQTKKYAVPADVRAALAKDLSGMATAPKKDDGPDLKKLESAVDKATKAAEKADAAAAKKPDDEDLAKKAAEAHEDLDEAIAALDDAKK